MSAQTRDRKLDACPRYLRTIVDAPGHTCVGGKSEGHAVDQGHHAAASACGSSA
jgi:hypothetical protein